MDERNPASLSLPFALLVSVLYTARKIKYNQDQSSISSYSFVFIDMLLWLLLSFLPASGLLFTLGTLMAERLFHLPSYGFCLMLPYFIHSISSLIGSKRRLLANYSSVLLLMGGYCKRIQPPVAQ
jgi:hypothetical protein